jgi:hypothetical protein
VRCSTSLCVVVEHVVVCLECCCMCRLSNGAVLRAVCCVLQIPLIPLPLPNVTIYFTLWRIISNRSAGKGGLSRTKRGHQQQQPSLVPTLLSRRQLAVLLC